MAKCIGCRLIIKDDFNNTLVLKKKGKKGQLQNWIILDQKLRGKETDEKCLNRAMKDVLKAIIFDLESFNEYVIDNENDEFIRVYMGNLKERYVLDKAYDEAKWINKKSLDNHEFNEIDKKILNDYFNSLS